MNGDDENYDEESVALAYALDGSPILARDVIRHTLNDAQLDRLIKALDKFTEVAVQEAVRRTEPHR